MGVVLHIMYVQLMTFSGRLLGLFIRSRRLLGLLIVPFFTPRLSHGPVWKTN